MSTILLLALITVSEATIGVFVKLTGDAIPIQTLNFYALTFAAALLAFAIPRATGQPLRFPSGNLKDTILIGTLIAAQISVFNYAMTLVPIANAVVFWSVAPFFVFIFSALFLGEPAKKSYLLIFGLALVGIVLAKPLEGGNWFGNLVALGDGAIYAAMVTYMRYEGRSETGNDIFWSMVAAAILLSPSLVLVGPGEVGKLLAYPGLGLSLPVMLWAAGLGVVSTGFAYFGISLVLKPDQRERLRPRRHHRVAGGGGKPRLPRVRRSARPRHDPWRRVASFVRLLADPRDESRQGECRGSSVPMRVKFRR